MSRVVIAGGSGFLGHQLALDLSSRGHEIVVLTRSAKPSGKFESVVWDGRTVGDWARVLEHDDVRLVNLAGKLIDVRPTPANIAELRESRVLPTLALKQAAAANPPKAWLQASTASIWSDSGDAIVTESTPLPTGTAALPQMTGVAVPWEDAASGAPTDSLHILRTSIVLGPNCPAWDRLGGLTKLGLGGTMGTGKQWFSWIHITDWLAVARAAVGLGEFELPVGPVNATSPNPVRNRDFTAAMRKRLAPFGLGIPTPSPILKLGAIFLRTDPALALTGRRVTSEILDSRYQFVYPTIESAIDAITG